MVDWHLLKTSTVCIIALIMGNYTGSGMTKMFTREKIQGIENCLGYAHALWTVPIVR